MPRVDEISESLELRRCIRDLVALSGLPAIWKDYNPRQIADSVATALVSMLDADLVCVVVPLRDEPGISVAHTPGTSGIALSPGVAQIVCDAWPGDRERVFMMRNPLGEGMLRVAAAPTGFGDKAVIAVGSTRPGFPTETQRLLLGIAAKDTGIALQRWDSQAEQRRLLTLIDRSSEFVGLAGLDGKAQYLNAAGCELLGLSPPQAGAQFLIFDVITPEDQTRARRELMPLVLANGRWQGELNLRHVKTGELIPFLVDWFRIDDPRTGRPTNMANVSIDLRKQRRHEADLHRLNESLEQRVTERTSELAHVLHRLTAEAAERRRADQRAHALQSELFHASRLSTAGQMAGTLAHELNQPLTAFNNSVNAARRMLANGGIHGAETISEVLEEAAAQALRAGEIIRRLREFVARGETEMRFESLPGLIREASDLAAAGTASQGVQVEMQFDPRAEIVFGSRIQLQQVLVNLMRNAHEAMAQSERRELTVATTQLADDSIEIAIADRGPGLPKEIADHLFEPFHTTKRNGMGLGLSICRSIVEVHRGKLHYQPGSDGGAVFTIILPSVVEGDDAVATGRVYR